MKNIEISFLSQPVKNFNIQYKCDERKDKCISGVNTKFPVVRIVGPINSSGVLRVTCVTHNTDFKGFHSLHPNLLINDRKGGKYCDDFGVAIYPFTINRNYEVRIDLKNLSIRHAKKDEVRTIRENWIKNCESRFDPYDNGYSFEKYDLQRLRLCCQAICVDTGNLSNVAVSDDIVNGQSDIKIEFWDDDMEVKVDGGEKIFILTRKLTVDQKEVIVRFFDDEGWISENEPLFKHHEVALVFQIPPYKTNEITKPTECKLQLLVQNKNYCSEVKSFKYMPNKNALKRAMQDNFMNDTDFDCIEAKTKRISKEHETNIFQNPSSRSSEESSPGIETGIQTECNVEEPFTLVDLKDFIAESFLDQF